jgi:hypothetical protein
MKLIYIKLVIGIGSVDVNPASFDFLSTVIMKSTLTETLADVGTLGLFAIIAEFFYEIFTDLGM